MSLPIGPQGFPGKNSVSILRFSFRMDLSSAGRNESLAYGSSLITMDNSSGFNPGIKGRALPVIMPFDAKLSNLKFGINTVRAGRTNLLLCIFDVNNTLYNSVIIWETYNFPGWEEVIHPEEYFLKKGEAVSIFTFGQVSGKTSIFGSGLITPT